MKQKSKMRCKYALLFCASFLTMLTPLAVVMILKWDTYTAYSIGGTVKLCVGGVLAVIFTALMLAGKLKMPGSVALAAGIFGFAWLMEAILNDLLLLSGMFLLGETIDFLFFQTALKRMREQMQAERTADATAERVEQLMKQYVGEKS